MEEVREYWFEYADGSRIANEEAMVAKLLDEDILFLNTRQFICPHNPDRKERTIVLFVLCNDVFAWACSDAECITAEEIPDLFELYQKYGDWGAVIWVCKRRGMRPQKPMAEKMKEKGVWPEKIMSQLKSNIQDEKPA